MGCIWADFPSGQRGLYGTNVARMLNGIYGDVFGASLVADPDPSIPPGGIVLRTGDSGLFPTIMGPRFPYPVPAKTEGFAVRLWLPNLPTDNDLCPVIAFKNIANQILFKLRVLSTGAIAAYNGDGSVTYGTTVGPAATANAYTHIEAKGFSDAAAGTIELRVNGLTRLNLAGLNTNGADIAQIHWGNECGFSQGSSAPGYWKDAVLWDTSGAQVNNFVGAVAVHDIVPDGDVAMPWTPSFGATGHNLVRDDKPANTLTATGIIIDGETVRIDNTYYRFTNAGGLDAGAPAGTAGNPWRVLIGGSVAATLLNLHKAIGATGVAGVDYSTALVAAHLTVDPQGYTDTSVAVSAKLLTASAIVTSETGANLAWGGGTLIDGPTDPSYISADNTPPAPAIMELTDLPDDVIAIKAVLPIARMLKTDGGDCNVEIAVSPDDGVTWDPGADRPITVASTYYWDVSHLSPATGVPWSPSEVDNMRLRADRTV